LHSVASRGSIVAAPENGYPDRRTAADRYRRALGCSLDTTEVRDEGQRPLSEDSPADASAFLVAALREHGPDTDLLFTLATAQAQLGADDVELALLQHARDAAPGDPFTLERLIDALLDRDFRRAAVAAAGTADPDDLGAVYRNIGLPAMAADAYGRTRDLPKHVRQRKRGCWWRTGGPVLPLRRAARRRDREALDAFPVESVPDPTPLAPLLDRILANLERDRAVHEARARVEAASQQSDRLDILASAMRTHGDNPALLRDVIAVGTWTDRGALAYAAVQRLQACGAPRLADTEAAGLVLLNIGRIPELLATLDGRNDQTSRDLRARTLRTVGLPVLAVDAAGPLLQTDRYGPFGSRRDHWLVWARTGGPLWFVRRRLREREKATLTDWPAVPFNDPDDSIPLADRLAQAAIAEAAVQRSWDWRYGGSVDDLLVLLTAALDAGGRDERVEERMAWLLYMDDQEEAALTRADEALTRWPLSQQLVHTRLVILYFLNRHGDALEMIEALPEPVRATEEIRGRLADTYQAMGLVGLAREALGPAGSGPDVRRRRSWWRTGGPFTRIRRAIVVNDRFAAEVAKAADLMPALDEALAPDGTAAAQARAVVQKYRLRTDRIATTWARTNLTARLTAGLLATAYAAGFLIPAVGVELDLGGAAGIAAGAAATGAAYLIFHRLMFRFTMANSWSDVVTLALPLIALFAGGGLLAIRNRDGWAVPSGWMVLTGKVLLAVAVMSLARLVAGVVVRLVESVGRGRLERHDTRAAALVELLELQRDLGVVVRRNDMQWRRRWVQQLQRTAAGLERDLPDAFGFTDPLTATRLRDGAHRVAARVRALEYDVATAPEGAWDQVGDAVRSMVSALATGDLHRLWSAQPPPAEGKPYNRSRRERILWIIRTVVIAALPLAVVLTATPWLRFNESIGNWARLIAVGWALLSVLFHVDPAFREKVGTMLTMISLGRGGEPAPESDRPRSGDDLPIDAGASDGSPGRGVSRAPRARRRRPGG
jgi:tetratricopeptide (TPR) repeat protein